MTLTSRLLGTVLVLPLACPAAAVTPEEVWTMWTDVTASTGGSLTATTTRNGNDLIASDIAITYTFPFGVGDLNLRMNDMTLTDQGDGSVSFSMPNDVLSMTFSGSLTIEGETASATGSMEIAQPGSSVVATGSADDMTFVTSVPSSTFELTSIDAIVPGEDIDLSQISMTGTAGLGTSEIRYQRLDTTYRVSGATEQAESSFSVSIPTEFGLLTEQSGGSQSTSSSVDMSFPRAPMSILNLSDAVRNGLSISISNVTRNASSSATSKIGDELISSQSTLTAMQDVTFGFGPDGLKVEGTGETTDISFFMPELFPVSLQATIDMVGGQIALPILASPNAPFAAEYGLSLEGLSVSEEIWSLLDPAQFLRRDPIDLVVDLGADVRPTVDTLDVMGLMGMIQIGQIPAELDQVRIDAFRVSAAGAKAEANGAFSLDFTDMSTFPDFPRPEGAASMTITGATGLIDTLIEMGILADEDAMPARLGLGMFTKPIGDDIVESVVEINGEGHVFVNDQRMR